MTIHEEILSEKQKELLRNLHIFNEYPIYLAGGTALALQLGHRTSLDFDFNTSEKFDNKKIAKMLKKIPLSHELSEKQPENTFLGKVNDISLSIFYYPYKLLKPLISVPPIMLASLAAMKTAAIVQRAKKRDFFDLYYLIENLGLDMILKSTYQKYPWYEDNDTLVKIALTYFAEADMDKEITKVTIFDKSLTWDHVKKSLQKAALQI